MNSNFEYQNQSIQFASHLSQINQSTFIENNSIRLPIVIRQHYLSNKELEQYTSGYDIFQEINETLSLAYLQGPICACCHTRKTPQWRRGWYNEYVGRYVLLCNACGLKYAKGSNCYYCQQIISKLKHDEDYISCKCCGKPNHTFCIILSELKNKKDSNLDYKETNRLEKCFKCPKCAEQ